MANDRLQTHRTTAADTAAEDAAGATFRVFPTEAPQAHRRNARGPSQGQVSRSDGGAVEADDGGRRRRRRRQPSGALMAEVRLAWSRLRQGRSLVERPPGMTGAGRTAIAAVVGLTMMCAGMYLML